MKITRTSIALIAITGLLALSPSVRAQTGTSTNPPPTRRGRGMTVDAQLARLETRLGETNKLTDAQKPKVKVVLEDRIKKLQELRGQRDSLSQEEMRAKMTAVTDETNKQMKEILTADQYKTWEQMSQRGRGGRGGGRRQGGGGGDGGV